MAIKDWFRKTDNQQEDNNAVPQEQINEALKPFKNKLKSKDTSGEGFENLPAQGFGHTSAGNFNLFNQQYIDKSFENEKERIYDYRRMSSMPEITDVIEDAAIESTQENQENRVLELEVADEELSKNEQTNKTLQQEFNDLFYDRIDLNDRLYSLMYSYFIDGRIYMENIINKGKQKFGIVNLKQLPAETMDFDIDENGKITGYYQFVKQDAKKPDSPEEADGVNVIGFYPSQITFIDSGHHGRTRKQIIGYLEKSRQPYNQLRLLETAVVIYRIVRAPERLVFRIDTGNMPKDKAMRYVEKVKQKMNNKQVFDPSSGTIQNTKAITSILDNYFLSQCISPRSEIPTLDGQTKTLEHLIDEHAKGKKNEVYSVDQETGDIIRGEVEWAGYTRKDADLVRVWFDNGEYLDCTPDHKFVMRDGNEVEAQNIDPDTDEVMGFGNVIVEEIEILSFKEDTGCLTIKDPGNNHNFAIAGGVFIKNSADGRGSQIDTVGGQGTQAFMEMNDIHYFQRKLYRALKYPMSRVSNMHEKQEGENMVGGGEMGQLIQDELKWAKFLERQQAKFRSVFLNLFLLHLEFKGLKKQYELSKSKLKVKMTPPNNYKSDLDAMVLQSKMDMYQNLASNEEFPKTFLMKWILDFTEDEIQELSKWHDWDKKLLPQDEGF